MTTSPLQLYPSNPAYSTQQDAPKVRWSNGIHCPNYQSQQVIKWGKYKKVYQRYLCKVCFRTFNDKTGTLFAHRHLSLQGWFWLIVLSLYGHLSWRRIGKILGVSEVKEITTCSVAPC